MPSNVEILLADCRRERRDRTRWLVLADALQEAGREEEAITIREDERACLIAGRVWPNRVPGWFQIYAPDHEYGIGHYFDAASHILGACFNASCGLIVRGEEYARQVVDAMTPGLVFTDGPGNSGFVTEPLELGNLPIDSGELEEIAEFITENPTF